MEDCHLDLQYGGATFWIVAGAEFGQDSNALWMFEEPSVCCWFDGAFDLSSETVFPKLPDFLSLVGHGAQR